MGIEEVLLGSRGVELPDPVAQAKAGLSLADLSSQVQNRQYLLKAAERKDRATQVLGQLLPQLQAAGWSEEAMRSMTTHPLVRDNPDVVEPLLKVYNEERKSQLEARKSEAAAGKDVAETRVKLLAPLTNQAYSLANKPDLSPEDIRVFSANIARNNLQGLVQNIPFQDWTNPEAARKNLKTIGSAFFEAEKQVSTAETGRHNVETERRERESAADLAKRRAAETAIGYGNLGVSQARLGLERENAGKPTIQTDAEGNMYAVDPRKATARPVLGPDEKPLVKATAMSAAARTQFAANNQMLAKIDDALAFASERPASFGAKFFGPDPINQRLDPKGVDARAAIASIASQKFHDLSGAAVTISEAPRLQPFIPSVHDSAAAIKTKLNRMRKEIDILQRELVGGRPTLEAIRAPAVTSISAAPDITSITRVE